MIVIPGGVVILGLIGLIYMVDLVVDLIWLGEA